jgi:hypothetical protein
MTMPFRYDTYCGLYCGACEILLANENGTREIVAKAWNRDPEQLRCMGCKTPVNSAFCSQCDIKACAKAKQVETCSDCGDYPCARLTGFRYDKYPHHSIIFQNLTSIQSCGMDPWLEQQRDRWTCATCGTRFGWYSQACPVCGSSLYNSIEEEKAIPKDGTCGSAPGPA